MLNGQKSTGACERTNDRGTEHQKLHKTLRAKRPRGERRGMRKRSERLGMLGFMFSG
jgi:hypothetical protein